MTGPTRRRRPPPYEEVPFPVTPMLDMAFQLLAFFVVTFRPPSPEARLDLYLPAAPAALPKNALGPATARPPEEDELDLETDLLVRAEADGQGGLKALTLGGAPVAGPAELADRLRRYASALDGRPWRIRLVADDALRYEEAARLVGACNVAGAAAIRLAGPPLTRSDRGGGPP